MTLDSYLERFIEGYLLEDLRVMGTITTPPGKQYGAVAYPMVMTALAGIEVLGVLTSKKKYSHGNGLSRFRDFWRQYVYAERLDFQRLDSLVYEMVRHGLAHSFLAKPKIRVTKHGDPDHLRLDKDSILILDALTLADDLTKAYETRLRPKITGEFKTDMEERFREFQDGNWQDHVNFKNEFDKAPRAQYEIVSGKLRLRSPIGVNQVHSPSIQPIVSTSDFGDPNAE